MGPEPRNPISGKKKEFRNLCRILTKEKATLSAGGPRVARVGLERRGQALSVQVQGRLYPITLLYTT